MIKNRFYFEVFFFLLNKKKMTCGEKINYKSIKKMFAYNGCFRKLIT